MLYSSFPRLENTTDTMLLVGHSYYQGVLILTWCEATKPAAAVG